MKNVQLDKAHYSLTATALSQRVTGQDWSDGHLKKSARFRMAQYTPDNPKSDSKSGSRKGVSVRVGPGAPHVSCGDMLIARFALAARLHLSERMPQ